MSIGLPAVLWCTPHITWWLTRWSQIIELSKAHTWYATCGLEFEYHADGGASTQQVRHSPLTPLRSKIPCTVCDMGDSVTGVNSQWCCPKSALDQVQRLPAARQRVQSSAVCCKVVQYRAVWYSTVRCGAVQTAAGVALRNSYLPPPGDCLLHNSEI